MYQLELGKEKLRVVGRGRQHPDVRIRYTIAHPAARFSLVLVSCIAPLESFAGHGLLKLVDEIGVVRVI